MIFKNKPSLVLAPMEGVTDAPMRAFLTEQGGFSFCVSEFFRISQNIPSDKVLFKHIPELEFGCQTMSGVPIQIQFLGGDPEKLAQAALLACELGARGVDLNFGCPAKTVNRHDGGASLLKFPNRIQEIVKVVRERVPKEIPVSAKLRLGWDDIRDVNQNAEKAALGGADWVTIHARTKVQGYRPPVYWEAIGNIRKNLDIPVVANGDINSLEDFLRCQEETGCQHYMLGRGAVANPLLARIIAAELGIGDSLPPIVQSWQTSVKRFIELSLQLSLYTVEKSKFKSYLCGRIKQWANMINAYQAVPWFTEVKRSDNVENILIILDKH